MSLLKNSLISGICSTTVVALSLAVSTPAMSKDRFDITVQATEAQVSQWQDGIQYVDDVQQNSTARIVGTVKDLPGKPSTFQVFILNNSSEPINFGPGDVSIEMPDGNVIEMTSFDELSGKLRRDIKRRNFIGGLGAAFSAGSANGYTHGSFDYSGTNSYGTHHSGSGTFSYYDPALAQQEQRAAQEQAEATKRAIDAREHSGNQALGQLLRRTTVQPGEVTGGLLAYEAPRDFKKLEAGEYPVVVIRAGNEVHRIFIKVSKLG